MAKRTAVSAIRAKADNGTRTTFAKVGVEPGGKSDSLTTAIHIPRRTWDLLRAVAFRRAQVQGGRASVSGLIVEIVEGRRTELEGELG